MSYELPIENTDTSQVALIKIAKQLAIGVGATGGATEAKQDEQITIAEAIQAAVESSPSVGYTSSISFTRPENTTGYGAGDVLGIADAGTPANAGSAIHTLAAVGPSGGQILITDVSLLIGLTAVTSGMTSFRLHLYSASPTAILDNAVWDLPSGDRANYLGYVDLGTPVDVGSTLFVQQTGVNKSVKLTTAALFAQLVTNGAYTPASATPYVVKVHSVAV